MQFHAIVARAVEPRGFRLPFVPLPSFLLLLTFLPPFSTAVIIFLLPLLLVLSKEVREVASQSGGHERVCFDASSPS